MKLIVKKGSTSVSLYLFIQDSSLTTGAGKTGLAFDTASLVAYYVRPLGSATSITLATLAAVTTAYSSGGFKEISSANMPGVYRFDIPDAAIASGVNSVVVMLKGATDMAPVLLELDLVAYDPQSATNLGLSNLDVASSTLATSSALTTAQTAITSIKGKTDQMVFTLTNKLDSSIQAAGDFAQGAADKVWGTTIRTLTAFGFTVNATVTDKTGFSLSTAGILAIWHQLTSAIATAGTIGKLIKDFLDAAISSRASQTSVDTIDNFVDTEITAIKAITDQITFTGGTVDANIVDPVTVGTNNDKSGYALSTAGVDAILDDTPSAELASIPGVTASIRQMTQFGFEYHRNKRTVTATTETLFKDDGSATLGTATLSDTGGIVTKGKMS